VVDEHPLDYRDPEWVAERLGIDKNTVYKHLAAGVLPAVRLGRKWLISERRLAAFLAERTDEQTNLRRALARITARAQATLDMASETARRLNHPSVGQEHLLIGICLVPDSLGAKMLVDLGVDLAAYGAEVASALPAQDAATEAPEYSDLLVRTLMEARAQATKLGHAWLGVEHFVLALLALPEGFGYSTLTGLGITLDAAVESCARLLPVHVAADRAARENVPLDGGTGPAP
jgi:excisionase family DNA binding protein